MSPARRKRLEKIKTKKGRKPFKIPAVIWPILTGFVIFLFLSFQTRFWSSKDKLSLVINTKSGDVMVSTFDPSLKEITNITIPGTTQVNVSRQLGTWRIKSVWALGQNEKIGGKLLAETVTKNFRFPTAAWADIYGEGFSGGNLGSVVKAIFKPYATNLKIGDKVKLAIFSLGIKNANRVDINLADTTYLKKTRLVDGEDGYIVQDGAPESILVVFSDPKIANGSFKVVIKDASSSESLPTFVGGVLEVLGAKVASVVTERVASLDCEIAGKDAQFIHKVAEIYSCKVVKHAIDGSFDMEFRFGESFVRRF